MLNTCWNLYRPFSKSYVRIWMTFFKHIFCTEICVQLCLALHWKMSYTFITCICSAAVSSVFRRFGQSRSDYGAGILYKFCLYWKSLEFIIRNCKTTDVLYNNVKTLENFLAVSRGTKTWVFECHFRSSSLFDRYLLPLHLYQMSS